jgi:hypothetical protein
VPDRAADVDVDPLVGPLPPPPHVVRTAEVVAAVLARRTARRADVVGPAGRQQTAEEAVLPAPCWPWVDKVRRAPGDRHAGPPRRPDVQATVRQHVEAQPTGQPQDQGAFAAGPGRLVHARQRLEQTDPAIVHQGQPTHRRSAHQSSPQHRDRAARNPPTKASPRPIIVGRSVRRRKAGTQHTSAGAHPSSATANARPASFTGARATSW